MDCHFEEKRKTKRQLLEEELTDLNELLHLPKHKESSDGNMIHDYHAYEGVTLQGYTDNDSWGVTNIYGVNRTTDSKMIDVVRQCISIIEYAKKHNGHI